MLASFTFLHHNKPERPHLVVGGSGGLQPVVCQGHGRLMSLAILIW
jgi:hypothetical protein